MGGLEAIAFTGGIGENAPSIRARALEGLQFLSVSADPERNQALTGGREGMFQNAGVALGVVASGEEVMIALETERILGGSR